MLRIDLTLKPRYGVSRSFMFKGKPLNVSYIRDVLACGTRNTLQEICKEIANQRDCDPKDVVLKTSFGKDAKKWDYFGLKPGWLPIRPY